MKKKIGIIGLGAIGAAYASILSNNPDIDLYVIASGERKERLAQGVLINQQLQYFKFIEPKMVLDAVIFVVKYHQLTVALKDASPYINANTLLISSLNGIDSEEIIANYYTKQQTVGGVIRLASYYDDLGGYTFNAKKGKLLLGEIYKEDKTRLTWIVEAFVKSGFACAISDNIKRDLWIKYLSNYSENISLALTGKSYDFFSKNEHVDALRKLLLAEVSNVAFALNLGLTKEDVKAVNDNSYLLPSGGKPSTLQDLEHHRKTEIEMFTLKLLEVAKGLNIQLPYAKFVYHCIKALEEK